MNTKTEEAIKRVVSLWDELMKAQLRGKKDDYGSGVTLPVVGHVEWNNPDLLFVLSTSEQDGYEGSGTQIGITRTGELRWEYQSHCSCDDFEDSTGEGSAWPEDTKKNYELNDLPPDWEYRIQENIEALLASLTPAKQTNTPPQ